MIQEEAMSPQATNICVVRDFLENLIVGVNIDFGTFRKAVSSPYSTLLLFNQGYHRTVGKFAYQTSWDLGALIFVILLLMLTFVHFVLSFYAARTS